MAEFTTVPVIDIEPFLAVPPSDGLCARKLSVAKQIREACSDVGFFYVLGHGIHKSLEENLESCASAFFDEADEVKMTIRMALGGPAWRGYFAVGEELTSGLPDQKEGLYLGTDLPVTHPLVAVGTPLHGANLFPAGELGERLRAAVDAYMAAATAVGQAVLRGISLSLGLPEGYIAEHYTADPLVLFRIFHYPPLVPTASAGDAASLPLWSVGEHTDYGLLTVLKQDDCGGLQVKTLGGTWVDAPPIPGTLVINLGDMLDKMTAGRYRSTPHRVRNVSGRGRFSYPLFLDPAWASVPQPLPLACGDSAAAAAAGAGAAEQQRWDGADLREFRGTYGEYVLGKVSKVFPQLRAQVVS